MLRTRTVLRKTHRGNVVHVVREHYLREDIGCGSAACSSCQLHAVYPAKAAVNGGAGSAVVPSSTKRVKMDHDAGVRVDMASASASAAGVDNAADDSTGMNMGKNGDKNSDNSKFGLLSALPRTTSACPAPHYLIVDTAVALHQIDVLEHVAMQDVIILQTVLDELRERSLPVYNRVRALCADQARRFYVFSNEFHRYENLVVCVAVCGVCSLMCFML